MIDPADAANRPPCGGTGNALSDDIKNFLAPLLAVAGVLGSIFGALKGVAEALGMTIDELIGGAINLGQLGSLSISAAVLAVAAYIIFQLVVITTFGLSWRRKCRMSGEGVRTCLTGVVNAVHDATIPPLVITAKHPHVDLVVKPNHWFEFNRPGREYVYCSDTGPGGFRSPMVKASFKSSRVCAALAAAFGGSLATPLIAIAAFNGIVATTGAATLAGSLAFFAFALLFWFAAIVGGLIAGAIAAAAADEDPPEADDASPSDGGDGALPPGFGQTTTIATGDLLTIEGPLAIDGNFRKSLVMRFVQESRAIGSLASSKPAPYTHADAMAAIPPEVDVCIPPRPEPTPTPDDEMEPELPNVPVP